MARHLFLVEETFFGNGCFRSFQKRKKALFSKTRNFRCVFFVLSVLGNSDDDGDDNDSRHSSPSATKSNQGPTSCLHCLHLNIRLRLKKGTKDRLQKVILDVNSSLCKPQVSLAALLHYFVFFQILMADQEEPLKGQTSAIQRVRHASQKLESADTTAFLSKFFLLYHQTRRY